MLQAIEEEIVISPDGKLPEVFRPMFGHKARVIVLLTEPETSAIEQDQSGPLMAFAGTIDWPETDTLEWQRQQRREWDREWDC
jgi:hypothetical protein